MRLFVLLLSFLFFIGCEYIGKSIEKIFVEKNEKEKCEKTLCTDSICLHWNDSLQRCGSDSALVKELNRKRKSDSLLILSKDSITVQKHQLEQMKKDLKAIDCLNQEIHYLIKENKKRTNRISQEIENN